MVEQTTSGKILSPEMFAAQRLKSIVVKYKSSLRGTGESATETEVLHMPVLNIDSPAGDAVAFRSLFLRGDITVDFVGRDNLSFADTLAGKSIYPIFKVIHKAPNGIEGRFNGYFVGENFRGLVHPLILVPCDIARACLKGPGYGSVR